MSLATYSHRRFAGAIGLLFCLALCCATTQLRAQDRPQQTGPTVTPEREREIRDSLRERSRIRFKERDEAEAKKLRYEPDRALFMPAMERTAIFRIGIPGWVLRLGLRAGREDFDTDDEYRATQLLFGGLKSLRVAAFANNQAYDASELLERYNRYIRRRPRHEPVLLVRAPGGGVQIHVKERRGKVKRLTLLAYGDEGAAVIRVKSRFTADRLREAIALLTEKADESFGIEIDTAPN